MGGEGGVSFSFFSPEVWFPQHSSAGVDFHVIKLEKPGDLIQLHIPPLDPSFFPPSVLSVLKSFIPFPLCVPRARGGPGEGGGALGVMSVR